MTNERRMSPREERVRATFPGTSTEPETIYYRGR